MKSILGFIVFLFLVLYTFCASGYYENLAGKKFQAKGDVAGVIKEEGGGATVILRMDDGERAIVHWDKTRFESFKNILQGGNRVRLVVEVIEGGTIQGISAKKIARMVKSKKPVPASARGFRHRGRRIYPIDLQTLNVYKKTVKYFNPNLTDRNARKIASNILTYSKLNKLDARLVVAVIAVESDFRVNALSVKGAIGLGQLMPKTAGLLKVNPFKIEENILGTASYLRHCMEQWKKYPYMKIPLALASYNAGPYAVRKYGGIPPYLETQTYVRKVLDLYQKLCG